MLSQSILTIRKVKKDWIVNSGFRFRIHIGWFSRNRILNKLFKVWGLIETQHWDYCETRDLIGLRYGSSSNRTELPFVRADTQQPRYSPCCLLQNVSVPGCQVQAHVGRSESFSNEYFSEARPMKDNKPNMWPSLEIQIRCFYVLMKWMRSNSLR